MKVVLFVFFALAALTGTAALLSVSMQALANDEMAPVEIRAAVYSLGGTMKITVAIFALLTLAMGSGPRVS